MFKVALGLEYEGTDFHGWQRQANVPSLQSAVEDALSRVANHPIETVCAGRTDAGVHATNQVIHFHSFFERKESAWLLGANTYLPRSIRITWERLVPIEFDARRSAVKRRYCYVIFNHRIRPSLFRHQATWCYRPLDAQKMHEAAQYWIGEHDFSSFRSIQCQSHSPVREIQKISVLRSQELIVIDIIGNAFLHHMVRNMAGVLIEIGSGQETVAWAKTVLEARDRQKAAVTAAPEGLYLVGVEYPDHFGLPSGTIFPWCLRSLQNELVS